MNFQNDYPDDWDAIRHATCERALWQCEHCLMLFPKGSTKALYARNRDDAPVILTVHHLDGDKANNDWTNLLACCQRCHLHIQSVWQPGGFIPWVDVPRWIIERDLPFQTVGHQLSLWRD